MDNKHHQEINVLDKENEILSLFKDYSPKSFCKEDEGFDWLEEEDSKCILFINPFCDNDIEINIGDRGEFTLFFGNNHEHYCAYQDDYENLLEQIKRILINELCGAVLKDSVDKWFGSCFCEKNEVDKELSQIFDFCFKVKEFSDHLIKTGYSVCFTFWNPTDNKTIAIEPTHCNN